MSFLEHSDKGLKTDCLLHRGYCVCLFLIRNTVLQNPSLYSLLLLWINLFDPWAAQMCVSSVPGLSQ